MNKTDASKNLLVQRLASLNDWLVTIYGLNTRLSTLLKAGELSDDEINQIKDNYAMVYLDAIVDYLKSVNYGSGGVRSNEVMMRYFGLLTGQGVTLQTIADELNISRERVRQIVRDRIKFYKRRSEALNHALVGIARQVLGHEVEIPVLVASNKQPVGKVNLVKRPSQKAKVLNIDDMINYHLSQAAKWHWLASEGEQRTAESVLDNLQARLPDILQRCEVTQAEFSTPFSRSRVESVGKAEASQTTYGNAYAKWTDEDDQRLAKAFRSGTNLTNLAKQFDRAPSAILSRLRKLNLF